MTNLEAWVPRLKSPRKFYLGDRLLSLGTPAKTKKFCLERSPAPPSYWKCDTLHAFVERGSAFIEDISKAGNQIFVNYLILLTYMVVILM